MNQTCEKWQKNLVSGPILAPLDHIWVPNIFWWILPLLDVRHCCKLSLYAISRKTNKPKLRKWLKNLVSGPNLAQIWVANYHHYYFENLASSVTRYHHVQYQKELIIKSWENLVTDGRTGRRTSVIS